MNPQGCRVVRNVTCTHALSYYTVHVKSATEEEFVHDQFGHQICSSEKYVGGFLMQKRSDDITKTKFVKLWNRFAYPKRTRRKMFSCQKSAS